MSSTRAQGVQPWASEKAPQTLHASLEEHSFVQPSRSPLPRAASVPSRAPRRPRPPRSSAARSASAHTRGYTYEVENNEHDLKGTLKRIPDITIGPDLNWLVRAKVDPVDFINRYGAKIVFLHVRDQKADGTWSEAVGEGSMDYPAIGRALQNGHFSGIAVIELAHERGFTLTRPLRESLRMSREYMRRTLGF